MTIIADTSPLHYAVQIEAPEIIFSLYRQIVIPGAVYAELTDPGAPVALERWVASNLHRIEIRHVSLSHDALLETLDEGEVEAIHLAQQTPDSILLIDEKDGRAEARRRGIEVTGLLGVIRDAALSGHTDFEEMLDRLKATDFRLSSEVEAFVRAQYRSRS